MADTTAPPRKKHSSWYLDAGDADRLAGLVDDLHYTTRQPKHVVLGAAVAVALEHLDEIRARLTGGQS
jgi:hypothetical protein